MEREELLRVTAKRFAEAQLKLDLADRDAALARTAADNARSERNKIEEELRQFVGRNSPRRVVMVGNGAGVVLIDMDLREANERVYVSLEKTL